MVAREEALVWAAEGKEAVARGVVERAEGAMAQVAEAKAEAEWVEAEGVVATTAQAPQAKAEATAPEKEVAVAAAGAAPTVQVAAWVLAASVDWEALQSVECLPMTLQKMKTPPRARPLPL